MTAQLKKTTLKVLYLNQKTPKNRPLKFGEGIICTEGYEFAGTFSPDGKEYYFTRSGGKENLQMNTIMVTKQTNNSWTVPEIASFSGEFFDFEPYITRDGKQFFFGSRRPYPGERESIKLHQWVMEKTEHGWSEPKTLDQPFTDMFVMYPTLSLKGTMYFTGKDEENGPFQLYKSERINGKYEQPVKLDENVNFCSYTAHPFIALDESYLLFDAIPNYPVNHENYIYITFQRKDGTWSPAMRLNPKINFGKEMMCASISPDDRYLFYHCDGDIYCISAKIINKMRKKDKK